MPALGGGGGLRRGALREKLEAGGEGANPSRRRQGTRKQLGMARCVREGGAPPRLTRFSLPAQELAWYDKQSKQQYGVGDLVRFRVDR